MRPRHNFRAVRVRRANGPFRRLSLIARSGASAGQPVNLKRLVIVAAVCFLIYLLLSGNTGLIRWSRMYWENRHLNRESESLKQDNERLRCLNERLEKDPAAVEKIAREELGMARKNELIYKIVPPGTAGSSLTAPAPMVSASAGVTLGGPKVSTTPVGGPKVSPAGGTKVSTAKISAPAAKSANPAAKPAAKVSPKASTARSGGSTISSKPAVKRIKK